MLFTDGVDTTSRKNSYDSTMNYAEESDSLIFPIYYNTYLDNRRRTGGILGGIYGGSPPGTTAGEYALGRQYLEELAAATGGHVFRPEATPGGLTRAFEGIAEELRRQYNIGYVPKDEGKPGQRKQIKVRVERPNLLVRARDSYVVGTSSAPHRPGRAEAAKMITPWRKYLAAVVSDDPPFPAAFHPDVRAAELNISRALYRGDAS